jgi:hypothetical protein
LIGSKENRSRKFTPKRFFHTIIQLVSGKNCEGYLHALLKAFNGEDVGSPVKSALCKVRKRISFKFFQDSFVGLLLQYESRRRTWNNLRIYAIDGLQLNLPRTADLIEAGFRGRRVSKHRQAHMLTMYVTHAYDVLGEVTKDLRYATGLDEITDAIDMVKYFEKNSLTLYDRLYISRRIMGAHKDAKNYFLARARRKGVIKEIQDFWKSPKMRITIDVEGIKLTLIKVKNPNNKKQPFDVFATNLPAEMITETVIKNLYTKRWEVENSFRDMVQTMKLEQWHSTTLNGILQELYAVMYLINFTRLQMITRQKKDKNPLSEEYSKPNFKFILDWVISVFPKILRKIRGVLVPMLKLMNLSTEKRKHRSRSYPRQLRHPGASYPFNNTHWDWEVKTK